MDMPRTARRFLGALAGGLALMLAGAAGADGLPFGQPKVAYSGVTVTEVGGQMMQTRVFYTPGHQRNEIDTAVGEQIMLMDFENKVSYMLMPMQQAYMEMPMGAHGMGGAEPEADPEGTVESEILGRETIGGQDATKYRYQVTTTQGTVKGIAWVTDDGILMRSESETTTGPADTMPGRMVMTLQQLQIGPQDPALFELPADYQKMGTN